MVKVPCDPEIIIGVVGVAPITSTPSISILATPTSAETLIIPVTVSPLPSSTLLSAGETFKSAS